MGIKKRENKEIDTDIKQNTNEENAGRKKKKKAKVILGILMVILVIGIVVYNLRLSRIDEDIYFTVYHYAQEGSTSTLYCYDASEDKIIEIAEIEHEGSVRGAVDAERQKLIYGQLTDDGEDVEWLMYDLASGQCEVCFTYSEIEELTGMEIKGVLFDRTDKSIVYLRFSQTADEVERMFLAKYVLDTGEITDMQETDHKYNTFVCNGNFYINGPSCLDVTSDGNGVLVSEKGDSGTNYFISDQNTGDHIPVASMPDAVSELFSYRKMQFIGESNNCVYVRSVMTIFDHWADGSIWIKEPGHIAKKIYSFFPNLGTVTIMY